MKSQLLYGNSRKKQAISFLGHDVWDPPTTGIIITLRSESMSHCFISSRRWLGKGRETTKSWLPVTNPFLFCGYPYNAYWCLYHSFRSSPENMTQIVLEQAGNSRIRLCMLSDSLGWMAGCHTRFPPKSKECPIHEMDASPECWSKHQCNFRCMVLVD